MISRDSQERLVALFLAFTFIATSFFYVVQPFASHAVKVETGALIANPTGFGVFTVTTPVAPDPQLQIGDLWGMFVQGVIKAAESAGYTILRKYVRQGLSNLTKDVWKKLLTGGKGQSEVFQTEPWDDFWDKAGNEAFGSALEGFAQGFQNEYELQKQKASLLKSLKLEPKRLEGSDAAIEAGRGSIRPEREAIGSEMTIVQREKSQMGCLFQPGDIWAVPDEATEDNTDYRLASPEETKKCQEFSARYKQLSGGMDQLLASKAEANKKDADLIAGNKGALSEASKTLVDLVCKPEPNIAVSLFLGLGDQIVQSKRKVICPYDVLKGNWESIVANTGTELNEASLNGWNSLAALVNPDTSDLGAAWKLSIGGHSVSGIAQSLGETGFLSEAAVGQIKNLTDFSGKTTTPASIVRSLAENSLKVQIEEDTRFIPTGHLLADLILTAGQTVLSTSLEILTDGLRKKQAIAKGGRTSVTGQAFAKLTQKHADVLYDPGVNPSFGGVEAAEARLAQFNKLDLSPPKDWNILSKLTSSSCPDGIEGGAKGGDIDACVMDDKFAQAVKERITVKEAIARDLLADGVFGFDVADGNPKAVSWQRNYPYRSLVIMRKYRVLPVAWELAALYIQENADEAKKKCGGGNCTLRMLISKFDDDKSPFYQMIDENWVLKIPPVLCALKGYGPEVQDVARSQECAEKNEQGICRFKSVDKATRTPEQCVDTRTCLDEDEEGKCKNGRYGYCLQEQKVIWFKGEQCDGQFVGCETFQDTITKQSAGYLKQSLVANADFTSGACTEQNAGCRWYSNKENYLWHSATFTNPNSSDKRVELDDQNKAKIYVDSGVQKVQKEWSSALADRVFLASSAQSCQPQAAGCRQVSGSAGTQYLRLPPASLQCDPNNTALPANGMKNNVEVEWYKRQDCQQYTLYCKQEYDGCTKYIPEGDTIAITGKATGSPGDVNEYRCPAACANIYNYNEQETLFDVASGNTNHVRTSIWFNADNAQKCSINDVGCEEFTNLDEVPRGEGKQYYSYLQRCVEVPEPESLPPDEVFYSLVGSDAGGGQPEKHYVVGDNDADLTNADPTSAADAGDNWQPKCADASKLCDCSPATAEKQKYDPRIGTILCREFVNAKGKVFYRYTDNLIYRTSDCTSFRRTVDGDAALSLTYSPSYSRQCSSQAANCREYRAPQAGNVRVLSHDNFEDGSLGGWDIVSGGDYKNAYVINSSNEGEIVGDHSLAIKKKADFAGNAPGNGVYIEKSITIGKEANYLIGLTVKAEVGVFVEPNISFIDTGGTTTAALTGTARKNIQLLANQGNKWQRFNFVIPKEMLSSYVRDAKLTIMMLKGAQAFVEFYVDDIVVKEVEGIEYLIRDSWVESLDGRCFKPKTATDSSPDPTNPAYQGCSLYRDAAGIQHAIQMFERVCPNEMAGCVQATVPGGRLDTTANVTTLADKTSYIIPDNNKQCRAEDNKCTAYGSPKLMFNTSGGEKLKNVQQGAGLKEDWNIGYFKVTPEENGLAQVKFSTGDTAGYGQGICRGASYDAVSSEGYRMVDSNADGKPDNPGDIGCREYRVGSKGDRAYFRDPGQLVCQPPAPGDKDWFYHTCEKAISIICQEDSDCPVTGGIQEKCNRDTKNVCLPERWEQRVDFAPSTASQGSKCVCDKSDSSLDCEGYPALPSDPHYQTGICHDNYKLDVAFGNYAVGTQGYRKFFKKPENPSGFVRSCPASAAGCRKISDPECSVSTQTLRNDYGRITTGVPCTPAYYFTEDLDTRTKECNGKVDVEQGCLLFNDESKKTFEYRKKDSVLASAISNPILCKCDKNPTESDCANALPASEFVAPVCYDRFVETVSGNVFSKLQKYEKESTDLKYDSAEYYAKSQREGSANLGGTAGSTPDANVLMKVKQDRQCKLWVACGGSYEEPGREDPVCFKPKLCNKWGSGNSCDKSSPIPETAVHFGEAVGEYGTNNTNSSVDNYTTNFYRGVLRSLSGIARPDYLFPNTDTDRNHTNNYKTSGGYGFDFDAWTQANEINVPDRTYTRLYGDALSKRNNHNITNSCRLYPQQYSVMSSTSNLVDACRTTEGSWGVYGFCLEPYPNVKDNYYGNNNYYRKVCTNNIGQDCDNDSKCRNADGTGAGKCGFRYFENACLTWYPVDRIRGQQNLFSTGHSREMSVYNGPERVYYCAATDTQTVIADGQGGRPNYTITFTPQDKNRADIDARSSKVSAWDHGVNNINCRDSRAFRVYWDGGSAADRICLFPGEHNARDPSKIVLSDIFTAGNPNAWWVAAAGSEVGLKRKDFASIDYIIEAGSAKKKPSYSGNLIVFGGMSEWDLKKGPVFTYSNASPDNVMQFRMTNEEGRLSGPPDYDYQRHEFDASEINHTNELDHIKNGTCKDGAPAIFAIQPTFTSTSQDADFSGWNLLSCNNNGFINFQYALSIKIHQTPSPQAQKTLTLSYNETYCKAYVAAVKDGNAVPDRNIESFDSVNEGALQLPDPKGRGDFQKGAVIYKSSDFTWNVCDDAVAKEVQDTPYSVKLPQGMYSSSFNCNAVPPDLQQKANNNRIDGPRNDQNLKILGPDTNGDGVNDGITDYLSLGTVHTQIPFQKFYEWWGWDGSGNSGTFALRSQWDGTGYTLSQSMRGYPAGVISSYMNHYWAGTTSPFGTKTQAQTGGTLQTSEDGNRPRIYGKTKSEPNRFAFDDAPYDSSSFKEDTIQVRFYTDYPDNAAKNKQLPIKKLSIDFADGQGELKVQDSTTDGKGIVNSPPPAVAETGDIFSGHGPFTYTYTGTDATAHNKVITVTVVDNWGAQSVLNGRFCKKTLSDGKLQWDVKFSQTGAPPGC